MSEFRIRNQCVFIAVYASLIVLCVVIMSSGETGETAPFGATKSNLFVCTACEKRGLQAFYVSRRAIHVHIHRIKSAMAQGLKQLPS